MGFFFVSLVVVWTSVGQVSTIFDTMLVTVMRITYVF